MGKTIQYSAKRAQTWKKIKKKISKDPPIKRSIYQFGSKIVLSFKLQKTNDRNPRFKYQKHTLNDLGFLKMELRTKKIHSYV